MKTNVKYKKLIFLLILIVAVFLGCGFYLGWFSGEKIRVDKIMAHPELDNVVTYMAYNINRKSSQIRLLDFNNKTDRVIIEDRELVGWKDGKLVLRYPPGRGQKLTLLDYKKGIEEPFDYVIPEDVSENINNVAISHDGNRIAELRLDRSTRISNIWLTEIETGKSQQISNFDSFSYQPFRGLSGISLSSFPERIAFTIVEAKGFSTAVIDLKNSSMIKIGEGRVNHPSLSPDGSMVVYCTVDMKLWIAKASSESESHFLSEIGMPHAVAWSQDSSHIYYINSKGKIVRIKIPEV